jgi:hypothetical protein
MALRDRFRRSTQPPPPRRALPPPGVIRRERRALARAREDKLGDLGGLILEMYRRDRFREDLLSERCNELLGLDARLHELDEMLAAARSRIPAGRCECGAPLPWGSHFCPNCGRPAGDRPVIACAECGHPLAGDARFCASCGAVSGDAEGDDAVQGETAGARLQPGSGSVSPGSSSVSNA